MFASTPPTSLLLEGLEIVWLNLLLSGDNAVVIAMAVRTLPERARRLGLLWGSIGAAVLRVLFLAIAAWLYMIPGLRLVGGLVLLWIAFELLAPGADPDLAAADDDGEREPDDRPARVGNTVGAAIRIIVVADVSMSIDNVFAVIGAAHGDLWLASIGIAISIPIVVWGSSVMTRLMVRMPWIVWLGGGVLGYVGASLMLEDPKMVDLFGHDPHPSWHPLQLALGALLTLSGWWSHRRRRRRRLRAR